jgi:hypothetical protein
MDIEQWWPSLDAGTRAWLIANNGDALPEDVAEEIEAVGGVVSRSPGPDTASGAEGAFLSDEETDWIESTANDEA